MTTKDAIQKIFEKKMSDAKDLIDEALNQKLAQYLSDIHEAKLDPVGKEDGDIDNDGDEDDTDSYLLNRRKKIGQAMKKEGMQYEEKKKEEEENVKRLDSRGLGVKRQSGLGKRLKNESVNEGAPDTELDHHKGKSPNVYEDDYLPKKKTGVAHKAVRNTGAEGY
jgi:hypothetical protein